VTLGVPSGFCLALLAWALLVPAHAAAQTARPSTLAIDTTAAIDGAVDANGNYEHSTAVDAFVSVAMGKFEAIAWPVVQRRQSGQWNGDIWIAALRYERPGTIGVRVDAGLIPSPVGLANLTVRRPHLNPTIFAPSSLFAALPPLEPTLTSPRANLLGGFYPLGGQVTVSGAHWDMRAGVIDTSPLRRRRILSRTNPPRFTNVLVGGGVTPFVGFRVGASVTHGGWQRAGENPVVTETHDATVVTIESEFSYAYTKLAGEWVRDSIDTSVGTQAASGWFVQGLQTLTPRWFISGRVERIESPLVLPLGIVDQDLAGVEEVIGFRVTPELTVRVGHRARRVFGRAGYDNQAAASIVWWRRWF
jgi:hypothetical protein